MTYEIGKTLWHMGDEVQVISSPYELHGGQFQDCKRLSDGKVVQVITPVEAERLSRRNSAEWRTMQEGFRRVREQS